MARHHGTGERRADGPGDPDGNVVRADGAVHRDQPARTPKASRALHAMRIRRDRRTGTPARKAGSPRLSWVAAWELAYGAQLLARELDRQAWIDALARAWCLIRIRESLTPQQASDQDDYVDRLLGLKFYPTQLNPIGFDGLIRNVQAIPIAEVLGLECPVCSGPLEDRLGPFWCPSCQAPVSSWTLLVVDILARSDQP